MMFPPSFPQITIIAEDGGDPRLSSTFDLEIILTDVNDNLPRFTVSFSCYTTPPLIIFCYPLFPILQIKML